MELSSPFQLQCRDKDLTVIPKNVGGDWVYIIRFLDGRPSLMLTLATQEKGGHFWTSVPEGRQKEAELIGPMIADHYRKFTSVQ